MKKYISLPEKEDGNMVGDNGYRIYRQGDVLIKPVALLPKKLNKQENTVLAYGEVTGHSHMFPATEDVQVWNNPDGQKFLEVFRPTTLTHQEHNNFQIEKGVYEIVIEREYSYFDEDMRKVVD